MLAVFRNPKAKWVGACIVSALAGYAVGNGHTTSNAISDTSNKLGQTRAWASCEDWRSKKTAAVAKQAIASAIVYAVPIPDAGEIPPDCKHPKFMNRK